MDIHLENLQKKLPLNLPQVNRIVKKTLQSEGIEQAALSIVFVTSQKIRALNKKYLGRTYATDVLAFDLSDGPGSSPKKIKELTGDVFISTDAVRQNVKRFKTSLAQETTLYIIHGILHLLGYDDHTPSDIRVMRKKEQSLLDHLGTAVHKVLTP